VLGKFFESLYLKVFVNVVVGHAKSTVYVESCKGEEVITSDQATFETTTLNEKMEEFISSYVNESPYHYVSILDTSNDQGAAPTCSKLDLPDYFEIEGAKSICNAGKWTYYTSKADISRIKRSYPGIGVDFIFSPFVLLSDFFKDKLDSSTAMYVLVEENYLSLCVFENSQLLFAEHLNMENTHDSEELLIDDSSSVDLELDLDTSIDDDDLEELDILDGFGDIEDLDAIEDINEFSESEDAEEAFNQEEKEEFPVNESEGFNEDYQRFLLIQSAVNNFYKDAKYKSAFVEVAYIADGVGVSGDLKRYLEEEMYLSAYVRHMDLNHELCEIAKREV